jgi:Arc/MetJ-type ribon-helix-helix transcriptional regulator
MARMTIEIPFELDKQIRRLLREGWYESEEQLVGEALQQFLAGKSYLGDSPAVLHRFAADALNESKPVTALKFVDRAISIVENQKTADLAFYQVLIELRVQILLVLDRPDEAEAALEDARERLPNNPAITRWLETLRRRREAS